MFFAKLPSFVDVLMVFVCLFVFFIHCESETYAVLLETLNTVGTAEFTQHILQLSIGICG